MKVAKHGCHDNEPAGATAVGSGGTCVPAGYDLPSAGWAPGLLVFVPGSLPERLAPKLQPRPAWQELSELKEDNLWTRCTLQCSSKAPVKHADSHQMTLSCQFLCLGPDYLQLKTKPRKTAQDFTALSLSVSLFASEKKRGEAWN